MTLYFVWWEDSDVTTDTYRQTTNLIHETGFGPGGDDDNNGGAGSSRVAVPKKGSGKNGAKGSGKGGKGKGNTGIPKPPPVKKEKKAKTPNQLARNVSRLCFVIECAK